MITAVDTNILLDVLKPNLDFVHSSSKCLQSAAESGSTVICDTVYTELCAHFLTQAECDLFLAENEFRVESLSREASFLASRVWRAYRLQGGPRTRVLADFIIGAHAQMQASSLLTRDRGFFRKMFPALHVVDPSTFSN